MRPTSAPDEKRPGVVGGDAQNSDVQIAIGLGLGAKKVNCHRRQPLLNEGDDGLQGFVSQGSHTAIPAASTNRPHKHHALVSWFSTWIRPVEQRDLLWSGLPRNLQRILISLFPDH